MHKASSWALLSLLAGIIFLVGLAGFVYYYMPLDLASLRYYKERAEFAMHPTARTAYEFGAVHFNSADPADHNIDRAEYFYRKVVALDENYPYAHHQLARISFLRGDFASAIVEINQEIAIQGDTNPNAYYVRGLIRGYQGAYEDAAKDYQHFLLLKPDNWAGYNDYAWVLLKAGRYNDAAGAAIFGLSKYPGNAWLLNSLATAKYEMGDQEGAVVAATAAKAAVSALTAQDWSRANPGNDPRIAAEGLATFKNATMVNLNVILRGQASSQVQILH